MTKLCTFRRVDGETIHCDECHRPCRWAANRSGLPKRNCGPVSLCQAPQRRLTWLGKTIIDIEPGDNIAWLAKHSGLEAFAKAWEAITQKPCGCSERQAWLNAAWKQLVREWFSEPIT